MKTNHVAKLSAARLSLLVWWCAVALFVAALLGGCSQTPLQPNVSWEPRPNQARAADLVWRVAYGMPGDPPNVGWVDVSGRGDRCRISPDATYPDGSPFYGWWKSAEKRGCVGGLTWGDDFYTQIAVDDSEGPRKFYQHAMAHEFCHIMARELDGDPDGDHDGRCAAVSDRPVPGGKMAGAYELLFEEGI